MTLRDMIATANRNLSHSKLRTLLTISAIFVGAFTLTLTTALNTGANDYLQRQLGNVSVPGVFEVLPKTDVNPFASGGPQEYDSAKKQSSFADVLSANLTQADVDKLQKVEGVTSVEPFYSAPAEYITRKDQKKYQAPQIQQDYGLNLDLAAGRLLTKADKTSIVLTESYLQPLGFQTAQDAVGATLTIGYKDMQTQHMFELPLTIVGVMRKTFVTQDSLFVSLDAARTIAEKQGPASHYIAIMTTFKDATNTTDEAVLKQRLEAAGSYTAISIKERISTVTTVVSAITAGLSVVGIIALLAASFGIINTLLMSVYERTQEIGLMKALGMHRRTVFGLFAIEAVLVGFWGSAIATFAGWLASLAVNNLAANTFLKDFDGFTLLVVSPMNAAIVIGAIMLVAFLAGTLPAIKASRLNPIDALRSE